ncbi:hypothetical protein H1D32_08000 [Anaerobacillus sp. CMMVII]|uniref:sigma factor n=1 Tax=Anaerobacillus sp. CMMVII TaxID=2755588 RepID=UPI0021B7AF59|nr:sigma factor [Anaerobacillus sp. CMMVII]MCT8137705.1 hypothetical protein [Anaerobacillus sp. CMMVII]
MNVNELSFEELVVKFEPLIKKQIKQLNYLHQYDELYQVGLIALWEASIKFNESKGQFPGYAKKYIRGKLLNFLTQERKYQQRFQCCLEPEMVESIVATVEPVQVCFPINRMLPFLSKTERIWLIEFYEHGKGLTEIAKQYNVSIDTVKTWRKRAILKLQTNLKTSELLDLLGEGAFGGGLGGGLTPSALKR